MKRKWPSHLESAARLGTSLGMSESEIVSRLRKALDQADQADEAKANATKLAKEPL